MTDREIITLYNARDEQAITETDRAYGRLCMDLALNILGDLSDAEECVNDTWLKVWNAIPPACPPSLRAFVCRIARNIAIDRYRRDSAQKRSAEVESAIDEYWECVPNGDAPIGDEVALREAINGFLASLDARTRVIFIHGFFCGI